MPTTLDRFQRGALLFTALALSAGYGAVGLTLLLAATVWEGIAGRRVPWVRSPLDTPFLAFGAAFAISGVLSPYRTTALGSLVLALLTIYLGYGTMLRVLRRDPGFLQPILWAWVVGGIAAAAWGLAVAQSTGRPPYIPYLLERNSLATTLLVAGLLSLQFLSTGGVASRAMIAAGQIPLILALLRTDSRGAWFAYGAGIILLLVLAGVRRTWRGVAVVLLAVVVAVLAAGPYSSRIFGRLRSVFDPGENQTRVVLAEAALAIFANYPITGTGLNTFSLVHPGYTARAAPRLRPHSSAHNIFLNMAAEGGVLGLAAFAAILLFALVAGWRWHTAARSPHETLMSAAVFAAFVGILVHEQFDATINSVHLSAGLWLLAGALMINGSKPASDPTDRAPSPRARTNPSVLMVSNGHGEDAVGMALAATLQRQATVTAYPLVGTGGAYRGVPLLDPRGEFPSGGFGLRGRALWADLRAGALSHWRAQRAALRGQRGRHDLAIAIGDVYCLTMAAQTGTSAVFVATAKSEYNERHRWVERIPMRRYARIIFARDQVTADALTDMGLPARFVGNPLMDTIGVTEPALSNGVTPAVTLLPGSRVDAYANVRPLLRLCEQVAGRLQPAFFCALAPGIDLDRVKAVAVEIGWTPTGEVLRRDGITVTLTRAFGNALAAADVVVGLAGTANEQAAGLGKPVVTFPGSGAQMTSQFVRLQKDLLGEALVAARDWEDAAGVVVKLLQDPTERAARGRAGRQRMGGRGAVKKIAETVIELLQEGGTPSP